jgi:hypothetical protein
MDGNELPDGGFQFGYAAMGAALDLPLVSNANQRST